MDASNVDCLEVRPGDGFTHQLLQSLSVGISQIGNENLVAAFLSDIFPNLKAVIAFKVLANDNADLAVFSNKWARVGELLPVIRKILIHKRNFALARPPDRMWVPLHVS